MLKKNIFLFTAIFLIGNGCAKIGTISGGDKDLKPPVMVGSLPDNYATNFKEKRVRIDFDEFIQLKDVNQQFNVSPPLNKKAKVWIKNKSVVVDYTDTLKENTTYTLNFGNSIADNNEGNILTNFEFVFSTGNYIDSMGIRGKVLDAFTLKPSKDPMLAMLYDDFSDSVIYKKVPIFTGRTNKDGYYAINNVAPGKYNLIVINDKNFNYKYDPVTEPLAFADTILILESSVFQTIKPEIQEFTIDTTQKDSTKMFHRKSNQELRQERNSLMANMLTFTELDKKQYIKNYYRTDKKLITIALNKPLIHDSLELKLQYFDVSGWYKIEMQPKHDSINFWITDSIVYNCDTLRTLVQYWAVNKQFDTVWKTDTLNIRYIAKEETVKKKGQVKEDKMTVKIESASPAELGTDPAITLQYPLDNLNLSKLDLQQKVDTVFFPVKFKIVPDSVLPRKYNIESNWQEQTQYKLTILPGSFNNIYNLKHDTIVSNLSFQKEDYYGKLTITVTNVKVPVIVQLLDKESVVYEQYLNTNGPVVFKYIKPKLYTLKIIYDKNLDRKYTTGDYMQKIQPEKVLFYKEDINVRSNWEMDLNWEIE